MLQLCYRNDQNVAVIREIRVPWLWIREIRVPWLWIRGIRVPS